MYLDDVDELIRIVDLEVARWARISSALSRRDDCVLFPGFKTQSLEKDFDGVLSTLSAVTLDEDCSRSSLMIDD